MKEVAILLLITLTLNGCGSSSSSTTAQTAAGGTWGAVLSGGIGPDSGFSFTTQFTVGSGGTLSISYFQFLNSNSTQCFPVAGGTQAGSMVLTTNTSNSTVTGTFSFTEQSGGNTLTLTGTVTGTETGTTLSGGSVTGSWTLSGGTGCSDATGGSFTMTQH
ncbi:MAG TPA: hypothetical protein VNX26_01940 [Candidatus Acidoferrum sp.]|nr:hypothetical protein [Candidatus Acidoferrum sp.]